MDHAAADCLSFSGFFTKAMPREEGGLRFVYLEAANESRDYQGEIILAKALNDSADYYLRYGNVDVDHVTMIGAAKGIPNYLSFEVGRPEVVKVDGTKTFVKAALYQGETKAAEMANTVWDTLTKLKPPARWYPSVGGGILDRDPADKSIVRKVRWTNIGLSRTPVNLAVPTISTVPMGVLAKSWGPGGLDMRKALEAGYGTDSATLSGGAALRTESLDGAPQKDGIPQSYFDFRDRMAGDVRRRRVAANSQAMQAHGASQYGLSEDQSAQWTDRFIQDLGRGLKAKKASN